MIDEIHDGQQRDVRSKSRIMEENLMVSIGKREIPVRIDSIVYVESRNRKVAVHTTEEEIEYYDKIEDLEHLAKAYNDTSNALLKDANTMNQFYRQELTKAVKDGAKDLGLTLSKSGNLTFDADKIKKDMTVEEIQERLQPIAKKLSFISEHIADNATANLNSVSTQYGATGKSYYNAGNRYDFRG